MATEPDLTHFNEKGDVHMVDVSAKDVTDREAVAEGRITMSAETLDLIQSGGHKKGDVLGIARTAGIMGAKKTSELVPLCHPLMLTKVSIELELERTGVEMEALTAVQVTLLTIYDMCKAVDRAMEMQDIRLVHKSGGKSGEWSRAPE